MDSEKILILGARRGLGEKILSTWATLNPHDQIWASSRRPWSSSLATTLVCDFANSQDVALLLQKMDEHRPHRIFCVPGGGPYGPFASKDFKDHEWALQVTFLTPLRLIYHFLQSSYGKQFVAVGSAIAEGAADPGAASYAAAKHALRGLISSLQTETEKDLRLFSPGYMNTSMLPPHAEPRRTGQPLFETEQVAQDFVSWAQNPKASWHWESRP